MQEIMNFATVLVVAVAVASSVGALYANGLRLWALADADSTEGASAIGHRTTSALCFASCVAIVLFALWLMVPVFH